MKTNARHRRAALTFLPSALHLDEAEEPHSLPSRRGESPADEPHLINQSLGKEINPYD
jgi:hypothetical protein